MSKNKKGIGAWLSDVFGTSHKSISENLSTEDYNNFVKEAELIRASSKTDDDEDSDDDDDEDPVDKKETVDPKNTESKKKDPKNLSMEERIKALESGFDAAQALLKDEQKKSKGLSEKLVEANDKLSASEKQKNKLRNSVNPLADEDITNKDGQNTGLTKVDIEARESYKKNHSEA
ncbi:hypothetical protein Dfri01_39120 [Dyadobacter frigoris]|uniref:hypothetical protein n=1 Tax=Dyadobacter frigoris TaxID=2576211 RepID=UPI0024A0EDD8|nr:hypothetical protein [Dyadobacter frigoris]GLU54451.1 hypothetical protein Dfri01_39120 [Dyadobacter frigoris]